MDLLMYMFTALILTEHFSFIKPMGLCDFAEKFPCEENEGSVCLESPVCKRQNRNVLWNQTRPTSEQHVELHSTHASVSSDRVFVPDQISTGIEATDQAASIHSTSEQVLPGHTTTIQVTTMSSLTNMENTSHSSTHKLTSDRATSDQEIRTSPLCPSDMVYTNCTICQGTCMDPKGCITNCTDLLTCVCGNEYLLKRSDCVPEEECGCFIHGLRLIPRGKDYVDSNCSKRCICPGDQHICDDDYKCSLNAVCEERNNVLQCYCSEGYTGDGVNCTVSILPSDCKDIYDRVSNESGVYKIKPTTWQGEPFDVYCNMTEGESWTVFQRRIDGSQDFFLNWTDYKDGFGTPGHEFWLGNDKIHSLTTQKNYELRIDVLNKFGDPYHALYDFFNISGENDNYRLGLGRYRGNSSYGTFLSFTKGNAFTTQDRDNDRWDGGNCATRSEHKECRSDCASRGAWWYNHCSFVHLNSPYGSNCLYWRDLPGSPCGLTYTEMKLRPT